MTFGLSVSVIRQFSSKQIHIFKFFFMLKTTPQTFQLYADLSLYINIKHILILCWQMTNYVHLFSLAIRLFSDGPNYLFFMQLEWY